MGPYGRANNFYKLSTLLFKFVIYIGNGKSLYIYYLFIPIKLVAIFKCFIFLKNHINRPADQIVTKVLQQFLFMPPKVVKVRYRWSHDIRPYFDFYNFVGEQFGFYVVIVYVKISDRAMCFVSFIKK